MDRDSFVARHQGAWERLDELAARRRPTGDEVDELVRLYQQASSHLSIARVRYHDTDLVVHLTRIVARANATLRRPRTVSLERVRHTLTATVPAAMWRMRTSIAVVAVVALAAAAVATLWLSTTPGSIEYAMPGEYRQFYVEEAFEDYYSSAPPVLFAIRLFLNNARIALMMFGAGALLALPTLYLTGVNGWQFGMAGSIMSAAGQGWTFWRLVLPHGMLELAAIFVAGGAGLHVGWALIAPGDRTRTQALREEGRRAVTVALAAAGMLVVAALLEAWITPSALPDVTRIATGGLALVALVIAPLLIGRQVASRDVTQGDDQASFDQAGSDQVGSDQGRAGHRSVIA